MAPSSSAPSMESQTTARIADAKSSAAIRMARARCAVHTAAPPQGGRCSRCLLYTSDAADDM
eukprot:18717-Alexandrium_andersonii.AAC.1